MKEVTGTEVGSQICETAIAEGAAVGEPISSAGTKRAIEEYFPIVEINRLAIPERKAFKPIYQMHKWFARRASCVFRAILLGALKPAGTDIMGEFYRDHGEDPDIQGKLILDPFMGGGTTVVEALRLGCRVIGIDLNPVAWFVVRTEVESLEVSKLEAAFERLANRETSSGRSVREKLLGHYKTKCTSCGNEDADIIYIFWVKSAVCTSPECRKQVPLFSDYLVAQRTRSIRFHDARCPRGDCSRSFDWEIEPAALVGESRLMLANGLDGAGEGRGNRRWTFSLPSEAACCPWCESSIVPEPKTAKPQRKKVKLSVLYCPNCATVFQYRGSVPEEVRCPGCPKEFNWQQANASDKGFTCPHCGQRDAVIESLRRLPEHELLPTRMYAIEGHCSICDGGGDSDEEEHDDQGVLDDESSTARQSKADQTKSKGTPPRGLLWNNTGKFYRSVSPADERSYRDACKQWEREKEKLPYPKQEIAVGEKTKSGLLAHHYRFWHQVFNPRQLLCLGTLASAIQSEEDKQCREMLLMTFSACLDTNNMYTRFMASRDSQGGMTAQGIFARHDFQPKATSAEQNVWGAPVGGIGTWRRRFDLALKGKRYALQAWDVKYEVEKGKRKRIQVRTEQLAADLVGSIQELVSASHPSTCLLALDSRTLSNVPAGSVENVITDPPYAGNVNYAELTDFYYVWLNAVAGKDIKCFAPDQTPKTDEIIVNPVRGKTFDDFERDLSSSFEQCKRVLRDDGLLVFTYHHSDQKAWDALLRAVVGAGFEIEAVYPVQSEAETSTHLATTTGISYDLIHVCRKRDPNSVRERVAWATIRLQIRREARSEIARIERGVYGEGVQLSNADRFIVLIGKCLQLYSRHYGAVVDHNFLPVPLTEALSEIRMMVEQLVARETSFPNELDDIDRASYIWLTALSEKKEIKSDEVHKATRGIIDVTELLLAGLVKRGRAGRGRTYEVKTPTERYTSLLERFKEEVLPAQPAMFPGVGTSDYGSLFIDRMHFLIALAEGQQDLRPWIERWNSEIPQFRAAAEYLLGHPREYGGALKKILGMLEVGPLGFQ